MGPLIIWVIVFIVSLFVLIKSSDVFTHTAEKIGLSFGLPSFIIGVTIVGIGTSLPELVSSIIAVYKHSSEIVIGNVVGSNITNIFLLLGIAAIIGKKINLNYEIINVDLPFLVASAFLLLVFSWDGSFTLFEGLLSVICVILYLIYAANTRKSTNKDENYKISKREKFKSTNERINIKTFLVLVLSALFIYFGAEYTVRSIIKISDILNIGKEIIAMGIVALGTSLPELMVTISSGRRGNLEMAVGNILGSNVFNTFGVMGISSFFGTISIPQTILIFGLPMMLIATLLYLLITHDKEITAWEGWILLIFYVLFIKQLFTLYLL